MRTSPDARATRWRVVSPDDPLDEGRRVPMDVELEALDAQLGAAGARARLAGRGSTQPTRFFAQALRARMLQSLAGPAEAPVRTIPR